MKKFKIATNLSNGLFEIRERKFRILWILVTDLQFESYVECEDYIRDNYSDQSYEIVYDIWYP